MTGKSGCIFFCLTEKITSGDITMVYTVISAVLGYLVGSVNFAILFSKIIYGEDIRNSGSGNPGATNSVRIYGKKFGAAVFLCDFSKGLLSVALARVLVNVLGAPSEAMLAAGFFAQLGHVLPVFHGFRGGKGVATAVGSAFAIMPLTAIVLLALFAVILFVSKYVAVASGVCAAVYPILAYFTGGTDRRDYCVFAIACSMLIILRHISNFGRISRGEEGKIK